MGRKRANGEGMIRLRPDGRWEARVTIDCTDGKQKYKSVYGHTKTEVLKKMVELQHQLGIGEYIQAETITLEEWSSTWIADYLKDVKQSTIDQYSYQFRVHINPALGKYQLQKVTTPMIQRFYNQLSTGDKPLSPKSIRNVHGVLHKCLRQAIECGYLRSNPCDSCKLPKVLKKEMHTVTEDTLPAFLEAIKGDPYEAVYYVDIFTGMRQAEIIGLTWDRVDLKKKTIKLDRQYRKNRTTKKMEFTPLKNSRAHTISIPDPVEAVLIRQKEKQEAYRKNPLYKNPIGFVFTNEIGEPVATPTVYTHCKHILQSIGHGEIRFHDLRHSYATIALQAGVDPKTVSQNLGHATVAFTLDVYSHVTEEMRRKSADKISDFINSLSVEKSP